MKICVFISSTNDPSNSVVLANSFIDGMKAKEQVEINKYLLKDMRMEHFSLDFYDKNTDQGNDLTIIESAIKQSDAFVIATPVWNFSIPANLKNLVDRMGSFALNEKHNKGTLAGKPFYIIFTGGVPKEVWEGLMKQTTSSLPKAIEYFGGSYIGHHFEEKCMLENGEFGLIVDKRPDSLETVKSKGVEFADVVKEYVKTGKAPIKQRAKGGLTRLLGSIIKKIT
ncbi:NAD(P)H-dependent oxidoreductase [Candidatus Peregrinibacteria bacterium]|jgi:NAD(P)H-dependent FMN reductase|nr:NAD(P)H-dependent oxidoreductase [Candidatus Peregrinibacteria bacterium]MBT3599017.1 NAD(P)H-dependent oxidoreductase [Candidatus Peregrinibacteria bacterium]MBT6730371.1 NAD(P)H-dependent oxidoreductase [Candidatus Peregrinibacteria bacterium]MBT7344724.1 NAD(P)H-dependent oxidoreductase [Candidatus Peregrinibacteria bacterium]